MGMFTDAFKSSQQLAMERKEYDKRIEQLKIEYMRQVKMQHEMQRMQIEQAMIGTSTLGQGAYITGAVSGAQQAKERFDPNKHEAYQIPLSQLVTMWRLKYGDEWVDTTKVHDGSFYAQACTRLNDNDMFENAQGWVRLREGAE